MLKIRCNVLVMVGLFSCVFGDSEDVVLVRPLVKKLVFSEYWRCITCNTEFKTPDGCAGIDYGLVAGVTM